MSYLNPLLSLGLEALPRAAAAAGVAGFIVPDLPFEESADLKRALEREGLALVQMVTPVTPPERLAMLCREAKGFVYAVTMTGTTGAAKGRSADVPPDVLEYMDRVKRCSSVPVCAGFGIRSREQVARFAGHVDGVVVGSALVEVLEQGEDVGAFLRSLRQVHEASVSRRFADTGGACPQCAADRRNRMRAAQSVSGGRPRRFADAGNLAAIVCR